MRWSVAAGVALVAAGALTVVGMGTAAAAQSSTSNNAGIESLQRQLNALGCQAGAVDGKLGGTTAAAIRWFQTAAGLTADGIVGPLTAGQLLQAATAGAPNCRSVPKPGPAPKPSGSGPPCTPALLTAAVQSALLANEKIVATGPYQCAGIWTYNAPTIASGSSQSQVVELLRWNGSTWQAVNRALYCENGSVPGLIYKQTCLAGSPAKTNPNASDAAGIQALQRQLNALGCNAGAVDGTLGPATLQALRWFQAGAGITVDGILGPVTSSKLATASSSGSPNCRSVPAPAPAPTTTTTTPKTGPPCTQALILAAAKAALLPGEQIVKSGPYQCAGVWTYNAPTVQSSGKQTQIVNLMNWNGSAWQVVNRALYCENGSVPSLIYKKVCQS
jgi:peptidoglycan hydrolase-like protein with peptidoglycan-binding domain